VAFKVVTLTTSVYFVPGGWVRSTAMGMCLSVCLSVRSYISPSIGVSSADADGPRDAMPHARSTIALCTLSATGRGRRLTVNSAWQRLPSPKCCQQQTDSYRLFVALGDGVAYVPSPSSKYGTKFPREHLFWRYFDFLRTHSSVGRGKRVCQKPAQSV